MAIAGVAGGDCRGSASSGGGGGLSYEMRIRRACLRAAHTPFAAHAPWTLAALKPLHNNSAHAHAKNTKKKTSTSAAIRLPLSSEDTVLHIASVSSKANQANTYAAIASSSSNDVRVVRISSTESTSAAADAAATFSCSPPSPSLVPSEAVVVDGPTVLIRWQNPTYADAHVGCITLLKHDDNTPTHFTFNNHEIEKSSTTKLVEGSIPSALLAVSPHAIVCRFANDDECHTYELSKLSKVSNIAVAGAAAACFIDSNNTNMIATAHLSPPMLRGINNLASAAVFDTEDTIAAVHIAAIHTKTIRSRMSHAAVAFDDRPALALPGVHDALLDALNGTATTHLLVVCFVTTTAPDLTHIALVDASQPSRVLARGKHAKSTKNTTPALPLLRRTTAVSSEPHLMILVELPHTQDIATLLAARAQSSSKRVASLEAAASARARLAAWCESRLRRLAVAPPPHLAPLGSDALAPPHVPELEAPHQGGSVEEEMDDEAFRPFHLVVPSTSAPRWCRRGTQWSLHLTVGAIPVHRRPERLTVALLACSGEGPCTSVAASTATSAVTSRDADADDATDVWQLTVTSTESALVAAMDDAAPAVPAAMSSSIFGGAVVIPQARVGSRARFVVLVVGEARDVKRGSCALSYPFAVPLTSVPPPWDDAALIEVADKTAEASDVPLNLGDLAHDTSAMHFVASRIVHGQIPRSLASDVRAAIAAAASMAVPGVAVAWDSDGDVSRALVPGAFVLEVRGEADSAALSLEIAIRTDVHADSAFSRRLAAACSSRGVLLERGFGAPARIAQLRTLVDAAASEAAALSRLAVVPNGDLAMARKRLAAWFASSEKTTKCLDEVVSVK
ncbi:hypothetical protein NFJ02_01g38670 [Pycnococcus provasolii]